MFTGEEKTVEYLERSVKAMVSGPATRTARTSRSPLVGITVRRASSYAHDGRRDESLKWRDDWVGWTKRVSATATLNRSD